MAKKKDTNDPYDLCSCYEPTEEVLEEFAMKAAYNGGQSNFECGFELQEDGTYSGYIYFQFLRAL